MRQATTMGIVLMLIGVITLAYGEITHTSHKKVIDIAPVEASTDSGNIIPLPPVLGGLLIANGIMLVVAGRRGG